MLEDLRVELGLVAVEDHRGNDPDVDELREVVVLERLFRRDDPDRRRPFLGPRRVEATRCS